MSKRRYKTVSMHAAVSVDRIKKTYCVPGLYLSLCEIIVVGYSKGYYFNNNRGFVYYYISYKP